MGGPLLCGGGGGGGGMFWLKSELFLTKIRTANFDASPHTPSFRRALAPTAKIFCADYDFNSSRSKSRFVPSVFGTIGIFISCASKTSFSIPADILSPNNHSSSTYRR